MRHENLHKLMHSQPEDLLYAGGCGALGALAGSLLGSNEALYGASLGLLGGVALRTYLLKKQGIEQVAQAELEDIRNNYRPDPTILSRKRRLGLVATSHPCE